MGRRRRGRRSQRQLPLPLVSFFFSFSYARLCSFSTLFFLPLASDALLFLHLRARRHPRAPLSRREFEGQRARKSAYSKEVNCEEIFPWRLRRELKEKKNSQNSSSSYRRVAGRPRRPALKRPRGLPGGLTGSSRFRGRRVGPHRVGPGRLAVPRRRRRCRRRRRPSIDRTAGSERRHGRDPRAWPRLELLVRLVLAVMPGCCPAAAGEQGQQEQQEHERERQRPFPPSSPPVKHGEKALSSDRERKNPCSSPLGRFACSCVSRIAPCCLFRNEQGATWAELRRKGSPFFLCAWARFQYVTNRARSSFFTFSRLLVVVESKLLPERNRSVAAPVTDPCASSFPNFIASASSASNHSLLD